MGAVAELWEWILGLAVKEFQVSSGEVSSGRRRITLAEARKLALNAADSQDARRRADVEEEARRSEAPTERKRINPKRLEEVATVLADLRDWACMEARLETDLKARKVWLGVRDWANGSALKLKVNLVLSHS